MTPRSPLPHLRYHGEAEQEEDPAANGSEEVGSTTGAGQDGEFIQNGGEETLDDRELPNDTRSTCIRVAHDVGFLTLGPLLDPPPPLLLLVDLDLRWTPPPFKNPGSAPVHCI